MREKITRMLKWWIKAKVYEVVCGERRGTNEKGADESEKKEYNKSRTLHTLNLKPRGVIGCACPL